MHSSFALASLLATAVLAKPVHFHKKRDVVVVTEVDVVYQYVYVTATADAITVEATEAASTPVDPITASTSSAPKVQVYTGGHSHNHHSTSAAASSPAPVTTVTTSAVPVVPTTTALATSTPQVITTVVAPTSNVVQQTSSAAAATSTGTATATTYQEIVLLHHNIHRVNHSASNIQWSDSLAAIATEWANYCVYEHNTTLGGGGYGQNIAAGAAPLAISNVITDMMYNGEMPYYSSYYGDANPDFTNFGEFGHFTQIVWKGTTQVGCATVQCSGGLENVSSDVSPWMTVCNYSPPGNMGGEYGDNIGSPLGEPTLTGTYGIST